MLSPVLGQKVMAHVRFVLLWVKKYDSYQYVALVGSIEFFWMGRVGRHMLKYRRSRLKVEVTEQEMVQNINCS